MVDVFTSELNPTTRAAVLGRLDDTPYDVLVIGGGVTGAGVGDGNTLRLQTIC